MALGKRVVRFNAVGNDGLSSQWECLRRFRARNNKTSQYYMVLARQDHSVESYRTEVYVEGKPQRYWWQEGSNIYRIASLEDQIHFNFVTT